MPRCVFLGDQVGHAVHQCCGGEERLTPVYACECRELPAGFTVGPDVEISGFTQYRPLGGETSVRRVPSCVGCPHRDEPVRLPRLELENQPPPSLPKRLWQEMRAKREGPAAARRSVLLNCDTHGYGDAIVAAWLAEGTRGQNPGVRLHATGGKRQLLELFGQQVLPAGDFSASLAEVFTADKMLVGHPPRVYTWLATFGINAKFARPRHNLTEAERLEGERIADRKTVLLFPQSAHVERTWPPAYWFELADILKAQGWSVVALGNEDARFAGLAGKFLHGLNLRQVASIMVAAGLVIGNDSAPCHMAGTLDVPALALLGPTTDGVFAHYPSVRCLTIERRVLECVGCWFGWGYQGWCGYTCAALASLQPAAVAKRVAEIMEESHARATL